MHNPAVTQDGGSHNATDAVHARAWRAYARWLHTNAELADVGAPGVAVWGKVLAYAVVLGAAPEAARALSPR